MNEFQIEEKRGIGKAEFTLLCGDLNIIYNPDLLKRIVPVQKERLSFTQFKRYRELANKRWQTLKK